MDVRREEEADERREGEPRQALGRRRQRLRQHHEREEEERRGAQRLAQDGGILRWGRGSEDRGEGDDDEGRDEIEALQLADDENAADQHHRQERQVAADPPCRRPVEQERGQRHAERGRIEHVLSADGEDEFRRDRPDRGEDQHADALHVGRRHRIEDEDQDERGDVDRLRVRGHGEDAGEDAVGDPACGDDHDRGEGDRGRVVRHDVEEAEHEGRRDQRDQVVEHQPVHRGVVEQAVDELDHGAQQSAKPLVRTARPLLSTR